MSLTSLLKQRDVRERFKAEFVKPRITPSRGNAFVPPSPTKHYALIGTAFDYVAFEGKSWRLKESAARLAKQHADA